MRSILLFAMMCFLFLSCEKYNEEILPVVGTYEGVIVGVSGPFLMSVSVDYGDKIFIEAPFDGEYWNVVGADIDDEDRERKKIDIHFQELEPGISIWGEGVFFSYSIQLDYIMSYYGDEYSFSLVATKY